MLPSQLTRRDELFARNMTALEQWPQRLGQNFINEMTTVAEGLELLAKEVDAANGDQLERSRNWRFVGNAYVDLADARGKSLLKLAAGAFKKTEVLLKDIDNPREHMKLNYCFGNTLFLLSEQEDLKLMQDARHHFVLALETANLIMPAIVPDVENTLATVDRIIAIHNLSDNLGQRIDEVKEDIKIQEACEKGISNQDLGLQSIFGELMNEYDKDISNDKVTDTRQEVLKPLLSELENVLKNSSAGKEGSEMTRSHLGDLAARMQHTLSNTSQGMPLLPAGSRADKVWKLFSNLKLFLSNEVMRPHMGNDDKLYGMEIYRRSAYADTYLHKPGLTDEAILNYESDLLRELASEIRTYSLRNYLTLITPIWDTPPYPKNPNGVFFSGSDSLKKIVADVCVSNKMYLSLSTESGDYRSYRWHQICSCHVALFDLSDYRRNFIETDHEMQLRIFEVSYELGIALTLGRPIIVFAGEDQELPFDVDIRPVLLKKDDSDKITISEAIDKAIYGLQRGGGSSSIAATLNYVREKFLSSGDIIIEQSLKMIDGAAGRDPVRLRHLIEPILGSAGPGAPQISYPSWPGAYPQTTYRHCFHVMPFRPEWAGKLMEVVTTACRMCSRPTGYTRGDQMTDSNIISSIWNSLSRASHIVVDLTGFNANVGLELGIAHTLGRNILLITQDEEDLYRRLSIAKMRIQNYATSDLGLKLLRGLIDRFLSQH